MPNISYNLIENRDKIEESNMRSSLIFNNAKQGNTRDGLMDKTILSIIISYDGSCKENDIISTFKQRFSYDLDKAILNNSIERLAELDLVKDEDGTYKLTQSSDDDFISFIETETKWLIDSIIQRASQMKGVVVSNRDVAIENIRKALSVYYQMYGYSFFKCQEEATEEKKREAISLVTQGLEKKFGQALITAIADTLNHPEDREKTILTIWAKAFISSQIMGLDPTLRNFKAVAFREKTFILDTDVVLNCLTTNARYSSDYRTMVNKLQSAGCKLIVPEDVIREVEDHADASVKRNSFAGRQLVEYPDEMLESKGSNVFIEDYVKTIRRDPSKNDMSFKTYIGNIYSQDDREVLDYNLKKQFGSRFVSELNIKVDDNELSSLTEKVNRKTIETEKGAIRTDDDNYTISKTDAYLYLAVKNMSTESNDSRILSHNIYLLTKTTRTIKAARELGLFKEDLVCNPNILISVLQETGIIEEDQLSVINLFENPFLAYSSEKIWEEIEPILADKSQIVKYKELQQLRHDFKVDLHKLITAQNSEERIEAAVEISSNGYTFTNDLAEAAKKQEELQAKYEEERKAKEEAEKRAKELEQKLKKIYDRQNTIKAKPGNNIPKTSSRSKKKGGKKK
ncbi:MAG: hypothetical protein U0M54_08345 [Bacteroidales bacterium]